MTDIAKIDVAKISDAISYKNFDEAFCLAKEEVNRILTKSHHIIRRYTKHLSQSQGKFIRALSLLTCARNRDGMVHINAVKLAAAVEILHLATLVHDDIIDDADVRRGLPSLQKEYGKRTAVICGDYLLCAALQAASSVENKQDYLDLNMPDYMTRICTGELYQHVNNGNFDLSVYQYLKIISGKTAALFEASFFAGAYLSDCERPELQLYKKMGRYLGMIFQLMDDCLDFEATENVAKKPVQSDYEKKVFTLPVIHAFRNIPGLKEKARENDISQGELNMAVGKSGGLVYTRMVAKKYYNKYMSILEMLDVPEDKKNGLVSILNRAYREF